MKLLLTLGIISLLLALFGLLHQELVCNAPWDWGHAFSWIHHETLVVLCIFVGVVLLFAGVWKR